MESLPSYKEFKRLLPLDHDQHSFIKSSRERVRQILNGTDPRILLIIGPCSIHDEMATIQYAQQLKELSTKVSDSFYLLMRVYCEKSRNVTGWKGLFYDPFLDGSNDIRTGMSLTRKLLLNLCNLGIPTATEFLDPLTAFYHDDLITWGSLGARTSSSQPHRQLASGLDMPIGIKNGVAGNVSAAINGVLSALQPHSYIGLSQTGFPAVIRTQGNPDAHIVLRGGESGPNYDAVSVNKAIHKLVEARLPMRLLIDCSHHNSGKRPDRQPPIFENVLAQMMNGNLAIRGMMLESHLLFGCQSVPNDSSSLKYGVSITDSCLDWEATEQLVLQGAERLKQGVKNVPVPVCVPVPDFTYLDSEVLDFGHGHAHGHGHILPVSQSLR